jgi:hypothetical protein
LPAHHDVELGGLVGNYRKTERCPDQAVRRGVEDASRCGVGVFDGAVISHHEDRITVALDDIPEASFALFQSRFAVLNPKECSGELLLNGLLRFGLLVFCG